MVCFYGQNRIHQQQCRQKGSKKQLRPILTELHDPKVHCSFGCDKQKSDGKALRDSRIGEPEMKKAVKKMVVLFMKETESDIAFMDCNATNHCGLVINEFNENEIEVYPSTGHQHNVENGYPPQSPDCSWLDGCVFNNLQDTVSTVMKKKNIPVGKTRKEILYNYIPYCVRTEEILANAQNAADGYAEALNRIIDTDGNVIVK